VGGGVLRGGRGAQEYERMNAAARARFDVEVLLQRAGLLACGRKYESYEDLAVLVPQTLNPSRRSFVLIGHAASFTPY
jgi:hypothetical protein